MKVQKNVSDGTAIGIGVVCLLIAAAILFFSQHSRFVDAGNANQYRLIEGKVTDVTRHTHQSDDGTSYSYSAKVSYTVDGEHYTQETEDDFSRNPYGDKMFVMYKPQNPSEGYVAEKDWMTGKYLPYSEQRDIFIFVGSFFFAFGIIMIGLVLPGKKSIGICCGIGLTLIGVTGDMAAYTEKIYPMFFMTIFGAVGILILYQTLFVPEKKLEEAQETNENLRLFIVRDILYPQESSHAYVIFALIGSNQTDEAYFMYRTLDYSLFVLGEKRSFDMRKIPYGAVEQQVGNYLATDISSCSPDDFKELNGVMKAVLTMVK